MDEVTQVLFGMDGFAVLGAVIDPLDGELEVLVETIDPARGGPNCGVRPDQGAAGGSSS